MAQQHKLFTSFLQFQGNVADIVQARVVGADQAGKSVLAHQRTSMRLLIGIKCRGRYMMTLNVAI